MGVGVFGRTRALSCVLLLQGNAVMSVAVYTSVLSIALVTAIVISTVNASAIAVPFHNLSLMKKQLLDERMKLSLQALPPCPSSLVAIPCPPPPLPAAPREVLPFTAGGGRGYPLLDPPIPLPHDRWPQGSIRMAVHRRRRTGLPPSGPPPPPDQSDHRGKERSLPLGKSGWAIFGTPTFGSQTPPPSPHF